MIVTEKACLVVFHETVSRSDKYLGSVSGYKFYWLMTDGTTEVMEGQKDELYALTFQDIGDWFFAEMEDGKQETYEVLGQVHGLQQFDQMHVVRVKPV